MALTPWGLSSLGRIESKVLPTLDGVIATLGAVFHQEASLLPKHPPLEVFFQGDELLASHILGLNRNIDILAAVKLTFDN